MVERSAHVWNFSPAPKIGVLSARVAPPEYTEQRARALMPRIPVTRLTDLTPLDELGLPVFSAVTPLARDLTTHLGKGEDALRARVSALMEAIERVSAESVAPERTLQASFADLASERTSTPDPRDFTLPPNTTFDPARTFTWMEAYDLIADRPGLLPVDLAVSPPSEGMLRQVDTNGLASGNTHLEAVVHALCEVIERDAISQHEFRTLYGDFGDPRPACRPIAVDSIAGPAASWIERIRAYGLHIVVHDITGDIRVPTFRACIVDLRFSTSYGTTTARFPGYGTHPYAPLAVLRAITEAIQSRLATIQGARDAYNILPSIARSPTLVERAHEISDRGAFAFCSTPSHLHSDLREDLNFLLQRLREAGFDRVFVTDLTRADLGGVPVVRVRVPGLAVFAVNRHRIGPRVLRYLVAD